MRLSLLLLACVAWRVSCGPVDPGANPEEEQLAEYLRTEYEQGASKACNAFNLASWDYATDVSNKTKEDILNKETLTFARFEKDQWNEHFRGVNWQDFKDELVKRQLQFLSVLGVAALNDSALTELNKRQTSMSTVYSTAKICPYTNQNCDLEKEGLSLDPGIEEIISTSQDYDELSYAWKAWRDASGANMRGDYKVYVQLKNAAAVENGFQDNGEMWRNDYESQNLTADLESLWNQVEPLYRELHTYVKRQLRKVHGDKMGPPDDPLIPAHILGNMWAQSWSNLYDLVKPFPNATPVDVTNALNEQNYTALRMFTTSDDFYKSLTLPDNAVSYDENAMLVRPPDGRAVVCHASAWDFCDRSDFRIKMCTKVNMLDFVTIHHEMGHIQYYLQYKEQPYILRKGANPGFHEAVGDTIALSVSTPQHLQKIGLLNDYADSQEDNINALMQIALQKVAFLPFGYLIDKWRWDVFSGQVAESQWNSHWWKLREEIQKVRAPVERSEKDFDPGAKYHVPGDSQYIAYFIAHILQFQMHKALCISAGQYDPNDIEARPLHKCDIFQSEAAGKQLSAGLSLGGSRHWSEALYVMTGERSYNGSALLEYFQPLLKFLQDENASHEKEEEESVVPEQTSSLPEDHEDHTSFNEPAEEVQQSSSKKKENSGESKPSPPPDADQTIPIAVGGVLGALVIVVLIGYFVMRRRARNAE